jgi:short-subunit dehydrogenase
VPVARRVGVVTGASSGIGEAIARALAADGWQLVLLARREARLQVLAGALCAEYELCDVGKRDDVERVAAAVLGRHPTIQLLVNNAGIPGRASFTTIDPGRLEELVRVNYLGGVWVLRAFLPGLEAAGRADVVNIVSVAGTVAFAPAGPYSASKHAQLAFSRATAAELRGRGIHVHTVNPGFVETEGFPQETKLRSALLRRAVVGPEHVAKRVLKVLARDTNETFGARAGARARPRRAPRRAVRLSQRLINPACAGGTSRSRRRTPPDRRERVRVPAPVRRPGSRRARGSSRACACASGIGCEAERARSPRRAG